MLIVIVAVLMVTGVSVKGKTITIQEPIDLDKAYVVVLEDDGIHGIDVTDFNLTCVTIRPHSKDVSRFEYNIDVPIKVDNSIIGYSKIPGPLSPIIDVPICDKEGIFYKNISYGFASTTIQLQDADTENLADTSIAASTTHGRGIIKFNTSNRIPDGYDILDSHLCFYVQIYLNWDGSMNFYYLDNQSWDESLSTDSLWDMRTGRSLIHTNSSYTGSSNQWFCEDVTDIVSYSISNGDDNTSIWFEPTDYNTSTPNTNDNTYQYLEIFEDASNNFLLMRSRQYSTASYRPYLNITYEEPIVGDCWTEETGILYAPPGCKVYHDSTSYIEP